MPSIRDLSARDDQTDASFIVKPLPAPIVAALRVVIWSFIALIAIRTSADPDLWGSLRFGFDILATHRVTSVDPYSFTQDIPWINHDWLAQVCMAAVYRLAGTPGLVLLKASIVAGTLWLVRGAFHGAVPLVSDIATALVAIGALPITLTLRAQLWTFLSVALLCRMLAARSAVHRIGVPLLFVLWVNCHAGWTVGLGVLVLWTARVAWDGDPQARVQAVAVTAAAVLASLANPYGWHIWGFSIRVAHMSRAIAEWQPLWTAPIGNWIPLIFTVVLVAIYGRLEPRVGWDRLICLGGLAFMSIRAVKFTPLFVEVGVLSLAPVSRRFKALRPHELPRPQVWRSLNAALFAVIPIVVGVTAWPSLTCLSAGDWRPDPAAAHSLIDARPSGRVAVWFDWGEYVIWHLGPRLRVSFDPRYDLLYSPASINEQIGIGDGTPQGLSFLERTRPEYAWYPQSKSVLKSWLTDHGYRIDVDTKQSFVAVRADQPVLPASVEAVAGCFPDP
jgi:hypothetical protein